MRTARALAEIALPPEEAADLWRSPGRWAAFVEGFARFVEVSPDWPTPGSKLVWESIPTGRGRVTEKVVDSGDCRFVTRVAESRLAGHQRAVFEPGEEGGSRVRLELEYELTGDHPLQALADLVFVRRALRDSLSRTLSRFAVEAEEELGLR
jgi:hypothetical protein